MKSSAATGSRSSSRPTRRAARTPAPAGKAESRSDARDAPNTRRPQAVPQTHHKHRAGFWADQTQPRDHPTQTKRQGRRPVGMAPRGSDPQHPQAPQPLDRTRRHVSRRDRRVHGTAVPRHRLTSHRFARQPRPKGATQAAGQRCPSRLRRAKSGRRGPPHSAGQEGVLDLLTLSRAPSLTLLPLKKRSSLFATFTRSYRASRRLYGW